MAVRPIDGNKLIEWFRPYLHTGEAIPADVVIEDIRSMPTLTQPNEPLTLEQLREMDGEPVWIVDVGPHKWYGPGWAIVDRNNCLVRTAKNWNPVFFERYGERWLAYCRPPEGET